MKTQPAKSRKSIGRGKDSRMPRKAPAQKASTSKSSSVKRKTLVKEMRRTEDRKEKILGRISDGVVAFDAQMNYIFVNARGAELLGRKPEDLIGKNYWVEYPQAQGTPFANAYVKALETQETLVIEDYYAPWDRWFENRIYPAPDGLTILFSEITERKRADNALRESEERYQLISTMASDYMFLDRLGVKGNMEVKWVAGAFESITGYTVDEFIARGGWRSIVHPDDLEADDRALEKLRANQRVMTEIRTLTKSGEICWVNVYAHPVIDFESGELIGVYGAVQDITERKQVEAALQESERQLSLIYANISDILFYLAVEPNDRFRFISVNSAFLKVTGFTEDQIIGKLVQDVIPESAHALAFGNYKEAIRNQKGVNWEEATVYPTGKKYGEVSIIPIMDSDGKCTHLIGTVHDITERKEAESELRLSRDRLAELSRRLVEVHETEARDIGRELHDQIGQILTALKLTIGVASQLPSEIAARKLAQAQELVDDLLNRISRLSLELRPPMLDDLGLLPALLWHVNRYQQQSGIVVDFKHSGIENQRFDPQIETTAYRIVQESLTNVARHAHAAHTRLEVRASNLSERGGEGMRIQIEDDGVGFDPQTAFEKYRGLNGMRERAQLVGGTVRIESEVGRGAKIFIELPLKVGVA